MNFEKVAPTVQTSQQAVVLVVIVSREALAAGVFPLFLTSLPAASALRLTKSAACQRRKRDGRFVIWKSCNWRCQDSRLSRVLRGVEMRRSLEKTRIAEKVCPIDGLR